MPVDNQDRPIEVVREEVIDQLIVNYGHEALSLEAFDRRLDQALSADDAWGLSSSLGTIHWDGVAWSAVPLPDLSGVGSSFSLDAIMSSPPASVAVAGSDFSSARPQASGIKRASDRAPANSRFVFIVFRVR